MGKSVSVCRHVLAMFLLALVAALPLQAWAADTDGDGVDDSVDAFPADACAAVDTDHDGKPDKFFAGCPSAYEAFNPGAYTTNWTVTQGQSCYRIGSGGVQVSCTLQPAILRIPVVTGPSISFKFTAGYNLSHMVTSGQPSVYIDGVVVAVSCTSIGSNRYGCNTATTAGSHVVEWRYSTCGGFRFACTEAAVDEIDFGSRTTLVQDSDDDNDGVADGFDKFPLNNAASEDGDNDGLPDSWSASNPYGCVATASSCNGLTLDSTVPQTITITQSEPSSAVFGASFTVAATASSALPVSIVGSGGCSGSGTGSAVISMASGSTACTVTYSQAGNSSYNPASRSGTTTATKATQSITITQAAPASAVYGSSFVVAATASSGLAVSIAVSGGCSLSGNTVTMVSGTTACTVTYSQAGSSNYFAATNKIDGSAAVKAAQSIIVTQPAPVSIAYGSAFAVAATASSGLPVSVSVSGGCSRLSNTVTLINSACTVMYAQVGDYNYAAAAPISSVSYPAEVLLDGNYRGGAVSEQLRKP